MRVYRAKDYADMSRKAANILSAQVIIKPDCVLGLATGSTPEGIYRQLIEWYQKGDLDFSEVKTVNLDEYCGLEADDPMSYRYFMQTHLFDHVNIIRENTYVPDGVAEDREAECMRYNRIIRELGGIDLQLLGIGKNGHIGFNEPGEAFAQETHCVQLSESTRKANARLFPPNSTVPTHAMTVGIKAIIQARLIVLVASGREKKDILDEAFRGPVTPNVPASILQMHPHVMLIADAEAMPPALIRE